MAATGPPGRAEAPAREGSRHGLLWVVPAGARLTQAELAAIAGEGLRGVRVSGFVDCAVGEPAVLARHLEFLREAAEVGLRARWDGDPQTLPTEAFCHLDPPRRADGSWAWPVPRQPKLTMRHGPGFVLVSDSRVGEARRFIVDDCHEVRLLGESCLRSGELTERERDAMARLAAKGLFFEIGEFWVALAIRYRRLAG